jgi:hypothetical protein
MSSIPSDIKPSKRSTRLMRDQQNKRILDYWKAGATDMDIMQDPQLKLTRRTFQRRVKEIRKQHLKEVLDSQQAEAKASLLKICEDKIRWLDMRAQQIIVDRNERTADRIAAMTLSRQYQMDIAKLSIEGPAVFRITENGLYRRDDTTPFKWREPPVLSEPATITESTNDERQF